MVQAMMSHTHVMAAIAPGTWAPLLHLLLLLLLCALTLTHLLILLNIATLEHCCTCPALLGLVIGVGPLPTSPLATLMLLSLGGQLMLVRARTCS
jgi:hypothetical protein